MVSANRCIQTFNSIRDLLNRTFGVERSVTIVFQFYKRSSRATSLAFSTTVFINFQFYKRSSSAEYFRQLQQLTMSFNSIRDLLDLWTIEINMVFSWAFNSIRDLQTRR